MGNLKATDKVIFKSACFGLSGNGSKEDKNIYHKIIFNNKIKDYLRDCVIFSVKLFFENLNGSSKSFIMF